MIGGLYENLGNKTSIWREKMDKKYNYEYRRVYKWDDCWVHFYEIVGEHGAIHLRINEYKNHKTKEIESSAGLEFHFRKPPGSMKGIAPSHNNCHLNHGPCWHEGTSYAEETYLPLHLQGKIGLIFKYIVSDADEKFKEFEESEA
jgi:hypothetical protein